MGGERYLQSAVPLDEMRRLSLRLHGITVSATANLPLLPPFHRRSLTTQIEHKSIELARGEREGKKSPSHLCGAPVPVESALFSDGTFPRSISRGSHKRAHTSSTPQQPNKK